MAGGGGERGDKATSELIDSELPAGKVGTSRWADTACNWAMDNRANFSWVATETVRKLWASGARAVLYTDGGFRPQQHIAASAWVLHMSTRSGEWVNMAQGARIHEVTEQWKLKP